MGHKETTLIATTLNSRVTFMNTAIQIEFLSRCRKSNNSDLKL